MDLHNPSFQDSSIETYNAVIMSIINDGRKTKLQQPAGWKQKQIHNFLVASKYGNYSKAMECIF